MKYQQGWTITELLIALAALSSIVFAAGSMYVAVHFILKFW